MSCRMKKTLIQIYEVQIPEEAQMLADLGVDHIGSVLTDLTQVKNAVIRKTIRTTQEAGAKSCLIPIFNDQELLFQALHYYEPDIVHFCDALSPFPQHQAAVTRQCNELITLQTTIKERFSHLAVMRSLSIPKPGVDDMENIQRNILRFAERFAPVSDFFLVDTLLGRPGKPTLQPVEGYVGITGEVCDWDIARAVIAESPIPVILAGGISDKNVFDAITILKPAGVDSCTQTNVLDEQGRTIRFKKDMEKVRRLISEARRADAILREGKNHALEQTSS